MDELDYIKNMCDRYISECEELSKEPPNGWTSSAANKSKIKRLGIELTPAWLRCRERKAVYS